jgi:uncharacterized membrane protein YphA (DoxX/SURF4 family)
MTWIAQVALASVFFVAGYSEVLACERGSNALHPRLNCGCIGLPCRLAMLFAFLEIAGAICLVFPFDHLSPNLLPLMAASMLALLMVVASIYRIRRRESAAPVLTLFLLAVLVIVGRASW